MLEPLHRSESHEAIEETVEQGIERLGSLTPAANKEEGIDVSESQDTVRGTDRCTANRQHNSPAAIDAVYGERVQFATRAPSIHHSGQEMEKIKNDEDEDVKLVRRKPRKSKGPARVRGGTQAKPAAGSRTLLQAGKKRNRDIFMIDDDEVEKDDVQLYTSRGTRSRWYLSESR
ncbi:hypothetical protein C0991_008091 [Blastosporella zonata]|nr:hypothetical protein C0991_008091 [Blastosporella zonata]